MKIKLNESLLFEIVNKNILNKTDGILYIAKELNVNKGTINRWIKNEKIPTQYFNSLNKIMNLKYELILSEEEEFKLNDMFFTPEIESKRLIDKTLKYISKNWEIDINEYELIDPSAGSGSFFNNFPNINKKIGIDLTPKTKGIIEKDYFDFFPKSKKNIVIGNPPFGLRGNLALKFINHSAKFSDFICFILPPLFNSNGKGSPMLRVDSGFYLAKEFEVKENDFIYPNGKKVTINSIFQIWTKVFSSKVKPITPPEKVSEWVKVYSLSNGNTSSSKRNIKMIDKCDLYLPSTTFNDFDKSSSFENLPHKRGYGIVFLKENKRLRDLCFNKINWSEHSFKSTNGANNIRMQIIIDTIESEVKKW